MASLAPINHSRRPGRGASRQSARRREAVHALGVGPEELQELNGRWWDWQVEKWDAAEFRLVANNDLTYHHAVAVSFVNARYVACPLEFSHPSFRAPTGEETERVRRALDGDIDDLTVFAWDLEDVEGPGKVCVVAAAGVTVDQKLVKHG